MKNMDQWIWYLVGALLTLVWKWQRYCYEQRGLGIPFWKAARHWFEIELFESKVSWLVTIAFVWIGGVVYIEKIGNDWLLGGFYKDIPKHVAFAFALGIINEMAAPAFFKWICSKIPFMNNEG